MRFVDTNVLVYSQDPSDERKRAQALRLLEDALQARDLVVSTQVLLEFYNTALRMQLVAASHAVALCRQWSRYHVVNGSVDFLLEGFALQQRYGLSMFDALIVRAAIESGCQVLYTEDLQHGMRFGALEVVNPFLASPAVHEPPARFREKKKSVRQR